MRPSTEPPNTSQCSRRGATRFKKPDPQSKPLLPTIPNEETQGDIGHYETSTSLPKKPRLKTPDPTTALRIVPATAETWKDLETLFGGNGACGGCWCQWARQTARNFLAGKGSQNRERLRQQVLEGRARGLLGYAGPEPVAWLSLGPRSDFPRLLKSRVLSAVDDRPVWSIVCLFVRRDARNRGYSKAMVLGARKFAKEQGIALLEAYPHERSASRMADAFVWMGLKSAFVAAGFEEVARRSRTRPIMRCKP